MYSLNVTPQFKRDAIAYMSWDLRAISFLVIWVIFDQSKRKSVQSVQSVGD